MFLPEHKILYEYKMLYEYAGNIHFILVYIVNSLKINKTQKKIK
jgi:hypothetical protein